MKKKINQALLEKLNRYDHEIDWDKGLEGMLEFPKILLTKSKQFILSQNYNKAKNSLKNYWMVSKMLDEVIEYKNGKLDREYRAQKDILRNLALNGYFENGNNEKNRAYENE